RRRPPLFPCTTLFRSKPDGPSAVRGECGAIETSVPGVRFCELFPQTAGIADRLAVVRSISHPNANHVQAALAAQTGHAHPIELEDRKSTRLNSSHDQI